MFSHLIRRNVRVLDWPYLCCSVIGYGFWFKLPVSVSQKPPTQSPVKSRAPGQYISDRRAVICGTRAGGKALKGELSAKIPNLIFDRMSTPLSEIATRFSKFAPRYEKFNFEV